jgi:hypothetical protein
METEWEVKMNHKNFSISFKVDQTPEQVFEAINKVEKWWTENLEGSCRQLDDEFEVRFAEVHYSKQKLVEFIPAAKVVWLITDSHLSFLKNKREWTHTKVSFEIGEQNNKTLFRFTHIGLVPDIECYNACSNAWSDYINHSLYKLITTGKGEPSPKE